MKTLGLALLFLLFVPSEAWVQGRAPATISELVTYAGKDREQCYTQEPRRRVSGLVHLFGRRLL